VFNRKIVTTENVLISNFVATKQLFSILNIKKNICVVQAKKKLRMADIEH